MKVFIKKLVEESWTNGGRKILRQKRAFQLKSLDPCSTYQVRVRVGRLELSPPFQVGPYLETVKDKWAYLENSEENPHFLRNYSSSNMSTNLKITSSNNSAILQTRNLCARSIKITVRPENCSKDCQQQYVAANSEVKITKLDPCTKYNVEIDLFLNSELENSKFNQYLNSRLESAESSDFEIPNAASFYTTPSGKELANYVNFDRVRRNLTWNFNDFLQQPCAFGLEGTAGVTIDGRAQEEIGLEGSKDLNFDCNSSVILSFTLIKLGPHKQTSFVAFAQEVPGHHATISEQVLLEHSGQSLRIVADKCLGLPSAIKLIPTSPGEGIVVPINESLTSRDSPQLLNTTDILLFLGDLPSIHWEPCADYQVGSGVPMFQLVSLLTQVFAERGGKTESWNLLLHPGWSQILANWSLRIEEVGTDFVKFESPRENCNHIESFLIEIVCRGSVKEALQRFQLSDVLTVKNLSVNTEYHCKARLIKVDEEAGQAGVWTDHVNVTTQEPELLLMQIIVEDEETRNLTKVASVTAKEIKSEESTTSLIVFLAIYSIVVALVIVIAYNCRGSRNPKYPYPIVSFLFSNTLQRRADHAISYDVKQNQFLLCMCTIWRNG